MEEPGLGRPVTKIEAQVLGALLETRTGPEEERIRGSGLSRSTFQVAKKRLYDHGLIEDRYLPNPALFGFERATFLLAAPFAEHIQAMKTMLAEDPHSVLVWSGRSVILAVLLYPSPKEAKGALNKVSSIKNGKMTIVEADITRRTVPCYFDFEGLWKNILGAEGVAGYPRPLGGPMQKGEKEAGRADIKRASELVRRPFSPEEDGFAFHLLGPHTIPRSHRKLIERGWVEWRVFPSFPSFPTYSGVNATDLILATGTLRSGAKAEELFSVLAGECHSFPFLYCNDEHRVLLAGLGTGSPSVRPTNSPRRSVAGALSLSLEGIEIVREPVQSLRVEVDHRYDRLFGAPSTVAPGSPAT